ncbi:MAG: hypothetical protein MHM6MM_000075 [Cercozoa sp. M6MM]
MLAVLVSLVAAAQAFKFEPKNTLFNKPGAPATRHRPIEPHHSLHHPFDTSSQYWQFGGATVMTNQLARIVPKTQARSGWLWNSYPLDSNDFETEFTFRVRGDGHLGGDGFAFWLLDGAQDPSYQGRSDYLDGPVFGMKANFKGFGVLFDTYDNDARRDNPQVGVLFNPRGDMRAWQHEQDYRTDLWQLKGPMSSLPHRCTSQFRNTDKPVKAMVRLQNGSLHVYLDTNDKKGYKLCLNVMMPWRRDENADPNDKAHGAYHLAFSALTGQLADQVDILAVTTRYLDQYDAQINDEGLALAEDRRGSLRSLYWLLCCIVGGAVLYESVNQVRVLRAGKRAQVNPVYLCQELAQHVRPAVYAQMALTATQLIWGTWTGLLINLPVAAYHGFLLHKQDLEPHPAKLAQPAQQQYELSLYAHVAVYGVLQLYYLTQLLF